MTKFEIMDTVGHADGEHLYYGTVEKIEQTRQGVSYFVSFGPAEDYRKFIERDLFRITVRLVKDDNIVDQSIPDLDID